jgi:hypothetical protein
MGTIGRSLALFKPIAIHRSLRWMTTLVLMLGVSCHGPETSFRLAPGSAFEQPGPAELSLSAVKPGEQWVLLIAFLKNVARQPLMLRAVMLRGEGLGSVVDIVQMRVAPLPPDSGEFGFVPSGIFKTYPPGILLGGETRCNVQTLRPISGYVIEASREARISVLMRAMETGKFSVRFHDVKYSVSGR